MNHGREEVQARTEKGEPLPDEEEKEGWQGMLIYRCPGAHHGPSGTTYDFRGVEGPCPDGWHTSLVDAVAAHKGEAPAPKEPDPIDDKAPTRAELEAEAKRLGVKLDSRNSDERLAERILEAMDAATAPVED